MNDRLTCGSLFSGIGLLDYGLTLAGWDHAFLCESDPWRREILRLRWPGIPVYSDVREVDRSAPRIDLLVGGFPCRGASTAGGREGFDHPQTALWREMARIARELRPRFILIENVANLLTVARTPSESPGTAWGEVLGELASLGYVVSWECLPAASFGAAHLRDRVFGLAALTDGPGQFGLGGHGQEQDGRADAEGDADQPPPDPQRNGVRQQPVSEPERKGAPEFGGGIAAAADARSTGREERDRSQPGQPQQPADGLGTPQSQTPSHPDADRPESDRVRVGAEQPEPQAARGTRLAVDWAEYGPAIERWEAVIRRSAGEPLLSGVVDGAARGLVRSQLSALGDGVLVQAGQFVGAGLMELAMELEPVS